MTDRPVLLVGVTQRSGTNYLGALLELHPALATPRTIREDHLPRGARQLQAGLLDIAGKYPEDWLPRHEAEGQLLRQVGDALLSWLAEDAGLGPDDPRRLLTRTPGADGVMELLHLVPDAFVVLLVRDGRDVVASGMRGLGWSFTDGVDQWLAGARAILKAVGRPLPPGVRVRLVRYEDVVADPVAATTALLEWLELDSEGWDVDGARELPVLGSSFHTGGANEVHLDPLDRPAGFDPRGRADAWPADLHARFLVRAATELEALGYPVDWPGDRRAVGRGAAREFAVGARRALGWLIGGS